MFARAGPAVGTTSISETAATTSAALAEDFGIRIIVAVSATTHSPSKSDPFVVFGVLGLLSSWGALSEQYGAEVESADQGQAKKERFAGGFVQSPPIADIDVTGSLTKAPTNNSSQSLYVTDIKLPIKLPEDGTYSLSVVANALDTTRDQAWFFPHGSTMSYYRTGDSEPWTERLLRSYAFRLTGDLLPEAATLPEKLHVALIRSEPCNRLVRTEELAQTY